MKRLRGLVVACALLICLGPAAIALEADGRPNRWGYDYPRSYDAEIAAPQVHRIRYEDEHIQFMEVSNPPGYHMQMHGHPYPSVFARASGGVTAVGLSPNERFLDPGGARNGQNWRSAPPPQGLMFPTCTAADPQAPHLPVNSGDAPLHFYRVEFKRLDQDDRGAMRRQYAGRPVRQVRYETDGVRLVEVTLLPRQTESRDDEILPSVLAFDTAAAFDALSSVLDDGDGRSAPPAGMSAPRCMTTGAGQSKRVANSTTSPLHYYRVEFKRVDGSDIKDHWREWYPFMAPMLSVQGTG